ncbi:MAG: hypothetical protein FWC96_00780 [Oscillospiraceae bacterium]|nr:hypothetical protein [Oscillospiraceae bacterium]
MFFITAEDLAYMILIGIAILGFICYIVARFMRWLGIGDYIVAPTAIGAVLGVVAAFSGSPIVMLIAGIGGAIISNLIFTHAIANRAVGGRGKVERSIQDKFDRAIDKVYEQAARQQSAQETKTDSGQMESAYCGDCGTKFAEADSWFCGACGKERI